MSDATQLTCQRDAFDLPADVCWLNSAYMAPLLYSVKQAGESGMGLRGRPWELTTEDFFNPANQVRELFARLIHADADGVAITPSVSYGVTLAARQFPLEAGQNIVTVLEQFPSNVYPWRKLAGERLAELRPVDAPEWGWSDALLANIDDRTAIVAIPNVHWTNGAQFDLARIGQKARDVGAKLLVDATQSLGVLPLDVSQVQPDAVIATGYKCLLGPYGLTYAWFAPELRSGEALEEAWLNRANAHDFSQLTEYCDEYMPGARRYDMGERANAISLSMAIAALEQLLAWTPDRVERYTRPLIGAIVEQADELGLGHPPLSECSPCMVGVGLPEGRGNEIAERLRAERIYVSVRKQNARVATHVYNNTEDVERLFDVLKLFV